MQKLPHTHSCYVCGESNALGLQLKFHTDGTRVQTEFALRPEHTGFKETIHGGILSTVLDEIMAWACAVKGGRFGYCAELTVRFVAPARPGQVILATADLTSNRRGRLFETTGELRDAQSLTLLASATAKYLALPREQESRMLEDLVGDLKEIPGWNEPSRVTDPN